MRNSVSWPASAFGPCGQVLPSTIFEFFGSVNSTIALTSINPLLRLDVRHFVRQREGVHRPVVDRDLALVVHPRQRVLHPVGVVAIREILARVAAAALGTVLRRFH